MIKINQLAISIALVLSAIYLIILITQPEPSGCAEDFELQGDMCVRTNWGDIRNDQDNAMGEECLYYNSAEIFDKYKDSTPFLSTISTRLVDNSSTTHFQTAEGLYYDVYLLPDMNAISDRLASYVGNGTVYVGSFKQTSFTRASAEIYRFSNNDKIKVVVGNKEFTYDGLGCDMVTRIDIRVNPSDIRD